MYTGHVGVALGAHGIRRAAPLWFLIVASQLPDWTDAAVCLADLRPQVPGMYSHSFPAIGILALVAALVYAIWLRDPGGMLLIAAVVVSHMVGDYVTGLKPTWPGGPMIGLELYRRPAIDFMIEALVLVAGWQLYKRSLPRPQRASRRTFELLAVLLAIQAGADVFMMFARGLKKC